MTTSSQKYELVKIRILNYLTEPAQLQFGATADAIQLGIKGERMVTNEKLLSEILREGLVERRQDLRNRKAKPFFITQQGKEYLEKQKAKAIFPEFGKYNEWVKKKNDDQEVIADYLRGLPEFSGNTEEDRIVEVSKAIMSLIKLRQLS